MPLRARSPLETARLLAAVYGRRIDPVIYTQGVGISGRLRALALDPATQAGPERDARLREIETLVEPYVTGARPMFASDAGGQHLAGTVWAEDLFMLTGDSRYRQSMVAAADRYAPGASGLPPPPADANFRTEDMFFAAAVLGRAFRHTGEPRYLALLAPYMAAAAARQRPQGLFWHCDDAPYFWGRGNGFAAIGFAEALTYLPADHPVRPMLIVSHRRHLMALASSSAPSGMLRQVLDVPDSYEELSATCMTGYAVARGLRIGWLDMTAFRPVLDRLWAAAQHRIDDDGGVTGVCVGTGVQPDLRAYLDRPAVSGYDDRGGSLALWFAAEMAACILTPAWLRPAPAQIRPPV
jgi:rhamnogalacturonyl hydrolase YesR